MFTVTIATDNAAFEASAVDEISACLERVQQRISREGLRTAVEAGAILDTNGNTVGKWTFVR